MSLKRKMVRSQNQINYVYTTNKKGEDILLVKQGTKIIDRVKLFDVNKNANGEEFVTIVEEDGTERTMLVSDIFKDAKKIGGEVKFLKEGDENFQVIKADA